MATPTAEVDQLTIVLIGNFNPAILQPRWMGAVGLIGEAEAAAAVITVITPDTAIFDVGDWLSLQVTPERFQATAPFSHALKVRDFAVELFSALEHTPIRQLGISRTMHFRLKDTSTRDAMGEKFAPATVWPAALVNPKLNSLRKVGKRPRSRAASLTVTIEPSVRIQDVGVFIGAHEHYEITGEQTTVDLLRSELDDSVRFALELAQTLVTT